MARRNGCFIPDVTSIENQAERLLRVLEETTKFQLHREKGPEWKYNLTKPQMLTLSALTRKASCTMTELAEMTRIASSALTGIIDRLIEKGLVIRERNGEDRRVVRIMLSQKGRAVIADIRNHGKQHLVQILSKIDEEDRENLIMLLGKVTRSLSAS